MVKKKEEDVKKKARGLLGFLADFIQVLQFTASLMKYGVVKAVVAATVVGSASYVGVKVYEQQVTKKQEIAMPSPTIAYEDAEKAVADKDQLLNEIVELFSTFEKKWEQGDMAGILALSDEAPTAENAQELERKYNRILLNWKIFDDIELVTQSAKFSEESTITAPLTYQGKSAGKITFVNKEGNWMVKDLIDWLYLFKSISKKVPQEITYVVDGEEKKVESLEYSPASVYSLEPYTLKLELKGGYAWWEGRIYLNGEELAESTLFGSYATLSEGAIHKINQARSQQIEIRGLVNKNPYREASFPGSIILDL
ncbi:hypothetical protein JXA63_03040 [Candidatus Woesebacteria bacterium]|nr:hypothetical protein [Candidatus Woesebacteria bacterium]